MQTRLVIVLAFVATLHLQSALAAGADDRLSPMTASVDARSATDGPLLPPQGFGGAATAVVGADNGSLRNRKLMQFSSPRSSLSSAASLIAQTNAQSAVQLAADSSNPAAAFRASSLNAAAATATAFPTTRPFLVYNLQTPMFNGGW